MKFAKTRRPQSWKEYTNSAMNIYIRWFHLVSKVKVSSSTHSPMAELEVTLGVNCRRAADAEGVTWRLLVALLVATTW
jgi:hypothetical protein